MISEKHTQYKYKDIDSLKSIKAPLVDITSPKIKYTKRRKGGFFKLKAGDYNINVKKDKMILLYNPTTNTVVEFYKTAEYYEDESWFEGMMYDNDLYPEHKDYAKAYVAYDKKDRRKMSHAEYMQFGFGGSLD